MLPTRRHVLGGLTLLAQDSAVQIYAAMIFRPALDAVLAAWRQAGGAAVAVYAPTPVLVRQIESGAPADIFLSADRGWMDDAAKRGLIRADTRGDLLGNALVLAGPAGAASVGEIGPGFPLAALLGGGRLAMCDPDHDPAGRFAKQSLQALGLWPRAAAHIAIAESAPAAIALLERGEVPAAIAFATDVHAGIIGRFPDASHAPILYPVALTQASRNPRAAAALAFLRSAEALRIFTGFGFRPALAPPRP